MPRYLNRAFSFNRWFLLPSADLASLHCELIVSILYSLNSYRLGYMVEKSGFRSHYCNAFLLAYHKYRIKYYHLKTYVIKHHHSLHSFVPNSTMLQYCCSTAAVWRRCCSIAAVLHSMATMLQYCCSAV